MDNDQSERESFSQEVILISNFTDQSASRISLSGSIFIYKEIVSKFRFIFQADILAIFLYFGGFCAPNIVKYCQNVVFLLPIPLRKQNFRSSCLYFPGVFDIYFV
jgi:hypothetical protein